MSVLILLISLFLLTVGNTFLLRRISHFPSWAQRRTIECTVLALPLVSLGISISAFCFAHTTMSWSLMLTLLPPLLLLLIASGALVLGGVRLLLVRSFMRRCQGRNDTVLQERADHLARKIDVPPVRLLLCSCERPLALTCGLFRPHILLSTWMVEHLDDRELEAVIAHELEHVAQQDYPLILLATILRDAFFYLPTSRQAYRYLQSEKELACDDLVVSVTRRPLALASALTKLWLYAAEQAKPQQLSTIQSIEGHDGFLSKRIERLLHRPHSAFETDSASTRERTKLALNALLIFQVACFLFLLTLVSCGTMPFFS